MNPKLLAWWREPTGGMEHVCYLNDENQSAVGHLAFASLAEAGAFLMGLKLISRQSLEKLTADLAEEAGSK